MPTWRTRATWRKLDPNGETKPYVEFPPGTLEKGDIVEIYFSPQGHFNGRLASNPEQEGREFPRLKAKEDDESVVITRQLDITSQMEASDGTRA